jgi:hypothetical protein
MDEAGDDFDTIMDVYNDGVKMKNNDSEDDDGQKADTDVNSCVSQGKKPYRKCADLIWEWEEEPCASVYTNADMDSVHGFMRCINGKEELYRPNYAWQCFTVR